jgi:hypothetical protein
LNTNIFKSNFWNSYIELYKNVIIKEITMKYNIIKLVRNTADQYVASVSATFDNLESTK